MSEVLSLPITRVDSACDVELPAYAHAGDAGLDLRAAQATTIPPFERTLIPTGLCMAIPAGHAGLVLPRSGLAIKHGLTLINTPGLIDAGYRGEVKIAVVNLDPHTPVKIQVGDRIAQLLVVPFAQVKTVQVDALDDTQRGGGGFGSSGIG
ncbi:MAG: dUTP diphosphatase [Coriobacteriia bacterium]|nr:dUTP diphosphatase [Coriobacteriia bacterium]